MPKGSYSVLFKTKIKKFSKIIEVDSDKSISIRSFLIGSICNGISEIKNILESEDIFSTISCLKKLGVKIEKFGKDTYLIYGKGLGSLNAKKNLNLNCGNSGTCARLLIGILSTTPNIKVKISGDKSLKKRNMLNLLNIMSKFGAEFHPKKKFKLPLNITSSDMPTGIEYESGVSSQLKSAAILASLNAYGDSTILEHKKFRSRDHTENILLKNSNTLKISNIKNIKNIKIVGKRIIKRLKFSVFGDPSSAAFPAAITMLTPNSYLKIKNVGLNPKRIGFYNLIKKHGGRIVYKNLRKNSINELVGDILIKSCKIKPIRASADLYPTMPDEYPILFIIAALTPGTHIFKGISELSNKESSRAYEMKKIINQMGIKCKLTKNEMKIFGTDKIKRKRIYVSDLGDHRICMSSAVLSLVTACPIHIRGFETVNTSSPSFLKTIKTLGGKFEIKKKS